MGLLLFVAMIHLLYKASVQSQGKSTIYSLYESCQEGILIHSKIYACSKQILEGSEAVKLFRMAAELISL